MKRAVFLADGSSDLPLADHLAGLCVERGVDIVVTAVDSRLLGDLGIERKVETRLRFLVEQGEAMDLVFVHRDAEGQPVALRRGEISRAALAAGVDIPVVPVVPVRMTEAWLLLDEAAIRTVAGRPSSRTQLGLPKPHEVEGIADPKSLLMETLLLASDTTGRRRENFRRDFGRHRALLIQRLDRSGSVRTLEAWRRLEADVDEALALLA